MRKLFVVFLLQLGSCIATVEGYFEAPIDFGPFKVAASDRWQTDEYFVWGFNRGARVWQAHSVSTGQMGCH